MTWEPDESDGKMYLCLVCEQVFAQHEDWKEHADGPWAELGEALDKRHVIRPGDAIPAGCRAGSRKCTYPDEDTDPVEWTDIERGDYVWDVTRGRLIGVVGHRDSERVDVEPFDGGSKGLPRECFEPGGRYRAFRLV